MSLEAVRRRRRRAKETITIFKDIRGICYANFSPEKRAEFDAVCAKHDAEFEAADAALRNALRNHAITMPVMPD